MLRMDGIEGRRKTRVFLPKKLANFVRIICVEYIPDGEALFVIFLAGCIKHDIYGIRHIHMKPCRLGLVVQLGKLCGQSQGVGRTPKPPAFSDDSKALYIFGPIYAMSIDQD